MQLITYTMFWWHTFGAVSTVNRKLIVKNHPYERPEQWTCHQEVWNASIQLSKWPVDSHNDRNNTNKSQRERFNDSSHAYFQDEHCFSVYLYSAYVMLFTYFQEPSSMIGLGRTGSKQQYLILIVNRYRYLNNIVTKDRCSMCMDMTMTIVLGLHAG